MLKYLRDHKLTHIYIPLILYWTILFIATSLPSPDLPDIGGSDKTKHFFAYFILSFLLSLTFLVQNRNRTLKAKPFFWTVFLISIYGTLDEIHQAFIPGRSCELMDWVADFGGALSGSVLVYFIQKKDPLPGNNSK